MISNHLKQLLHQADLAASALGQEANALHDFRIALRSLHSWLKAFGKGDNIAPVLAKDISRLASATNHGRDLEVLALWVDVQVVSMSETPALRRYVAALHHQREQAAKHAIAHIRQQWPALGNRVQLAASQSSHLAGKDTFARLAQDKLNRRISRLSELINMIGADESATSARRLHKCRINIKQIRYLLAPFTDWNRRCQIALQDLKRAQDQLGDYHDLCIFTEMLEPAVGQCDGAEALLALAEQQRRECFSRLRQQLFTPPMPWLQRLGDCLAILTTEQGK